MKLFEKLRTWKTRARAETPLFPSSAFFHPTGALSQKRYFCFILGASLSLFVFNLLLDQILIWPSTHFAQKHWKLTLSVSVFFHASVFFFVSAWNLRRGSDLVGKRIKGHQALIWSTPICSPLLGLYHLFFLTLFSGKITRPNTPRTPFLKRKYILGFILFHCCFIHWKAHFKNDERLPFDSENKVISQVYDQIAFQLEDYLNPGAKYLFLTLLEFRHLSQLKREIEMGRLPSADLIGPEQQIRGLDSIIDRFSDKKTLSILGKILLQSISVQYWMEARARLNAGLEGPTELKRKVLENSIVLGLFDQIFRIHSRIGDQSPAQRTSPLGAIYMTGSPELIVIHGIEYSIESQYRQIFYEKQVGSIQRLAFEIDLDLKKYPSHKGLLKQKIHVEKLMILLQSALHTEMRPIFFSL